MTKAFGFKGTAAEVQAFPGRARNRPGAFRGVVGGAGGGREPADWKVRTVMREVFPLQLPAVFGYEVGRGRGGRPRVDGFAVGTRFSGSVIGGGTRVRRGGGGHWPAKPAEVAFTDAAAVAGGGRHRPLTG